MGLFAKFLASKVSGWMAILGLVAVLSMSGIVVKIVYDYKELQRAAAFCEGQVAQLKIVRDLQERAVEQVEETAEEVIENVEDIKKEYEDVVVESPEGCAAQRAPESILRYHGWLPD